MANARIRVLEDDMPLWQRLLITLATMLVELLRFRSGKC